MTRVPERAVVRDVNDIKGCAARGPVAVSGAPRESEEPRRFGDVLRERTENRDAKVGHGSADERRDAIAVTRDPRPSTGGDAPVSSQLLAAHLLPAGIALPPTATIALDWHAPLVEGIVRAVQFGKFEGRTDLRIEARPGVLGGLTIHLTARDGRLSLTLESDSEKAIERLNAGLPNVVEALSSRGVRIAAVRCVARRAGLATASRHPRGGASSR